MMRLWVQANRTARHPTGFMRLPWTQRRQWNWRLCQGEETRTQCVSQVLDGRIYVFSGGDAEALLILNALENAWSAVGEVSFDAPCGEGLVLNGDYIYSINGEIKPGTRTCRMYGGLLVR